MGTMTIDTQLDGEICIPTLELERWHFHSEKVRGSILFFVFSQSTLLPPTSKGILRLTRSQHRRRPCSTRTETIFFTLTLGMVRFIGNNSTDWRSYSRPIGGNEIHPNREEEMVVGHFLICQANRTIRNVIFDEKSERTVMQILAVLPR